MLTPAALECSWCGEFQRQLLQFSDPMVQGTFECCVAAQASLQTLSALWRELSLRPHGALIWQRKEELLSTHYTHA